MTNKKMTTPYANGEGLATLPYGNKQPLLSCGWGAVTVVDIFA